MVTLARTTSGLLYASDGSLSGWSGDAQWTSASNPTMVSFGPLDHSLLPLIEASIRDGVREPQGYQESGIHYIFCDYGNGIDPWRSLIFQSADRSRTYDGRRELGAGLSKVTTGTWPAVAQGWVEKRGSTYYQHRVTAVANGPPPNYGLPCPPYNWDIWTAPFLDGPWTGIRDITGQLPGSVVKMGATYYGFCQLDAPATMNLRTSSTPDGAYASEVLVANSSTTGLGGRMPENPKVFYSTALSRYVCLGNLIHTGGLYTDQNAIGTSSAVDDWSSAVWYRYMRPSSLWGSNAMGVACHWTGPDGVLIAGPGGEIPILYDSSPIRHFPNWHLGRKIRPAVLEPSASCLRCNTSGSSTTYRITRSLSHTNIEAEYVICIRAGASAEVSFEYRMDSSGLNGYRATLLSSGLRLYKVVGGSPAGSGILTAALTPETYYLHVVRVSCVGNVHNLYLDGELQVTFTDSSSPITSGTHIGISNKSGDTDVRNLTCRTSRTVTVNGMTKGTSVTVRAHGGMPATSVYAGSSQSGSFSGDHPYWNAIEVDGTDYTLGDNRIDGGDVLEFTGLPIASASVAAARRGMW